MADITEVFTKLPNAMRYIVAFVFTMAYLSVYVWVFSSGHPYLVGLFPVILCSVFLSAGPGTVSLLITTSFIGAFESGGEKGLVHALALGLFFCEGLIVIWIAEKRRAARVRLAEALHQRDHELKELQAAHVKLTRTAGSRDQSVEQLKRQNEVMLDTLERILGKSNR